MKGLKKVNLILVIFSILFSLQLKNISQAQTTLEWAALGVVDRNSDKISDLAFIAFTGSGKELAGVLYDNDQDGQYDYGLIDNNSNSAKALTHFWTDRNQNGDIEGNELRRLARQMPFPWATFPSSYFRKTNETSDAIEHFMDYTEDSCFEEIARDLDKDGDVESYALNSHVAVCDALSYRFVLLDADNNGSFDSARAFYVDETGILVKQEFHFPKSMENQLPVMHYPQ